MLAAIAALQDFTVAQVTAYCAADDRAVIDALTSAGAEGLVERVRRDEPAADLDHTRGSTTATPTTTWLSFGCCARRRRWSSAPTSSRRRSAA
jgi:hypothetical protein